VQLAVTDWNEFVETTYNSFRQFNTSATHTLNMSIYKAIFRWFLTLS